MNVICFVCARHGHPIRYKDIEYFWRVKVPDGRVAESSAKECETGCGIAHLEDVEETGAIMPTGHQPRMGHEVRLVAQRRLAALLQPGHGYDRYRGTPQTVGILLLQGLLSPSSSNVCCSVNCPDFVWMV